MTKDGRVLKTDAYLLDYLVSEQIFESVFAANYVMERCAWDFQESGKFLSWAEVYRDWKIYFMSEDQDGKRIFPITSKEATSRAIDNTNRGERAPAEELI